MVPICPQKLVRCYVPREAYWEHCLFLSSARSQAPAGKPSTSTIAPPDSLRGRFCVKPFPSRCGDPLASYCPRLCFCPTSPSNCLILKVSASFFDLSALPSFGGQCHSTLRNFPSTNISFFPPPSPDNHHSTVSISSAFVDFTRSEVIQYLSSSV